MFIIAGKSCSGKDKLSRTLIERGYKRIITYTTRPPRPKEKNGLDYNFIDEKSFLDLQEKGFFAETKAYHTVDGIWYYGSAVKDYKNEDNLFIILTPSGIEDVKKKVNFNHHVIYLFANHETIKNRLKKRGDNPEEAKRRMEQDNLDFKGFENIADRIIYNNEGYDLEKDVLPKVEKYLNNKKY